MMVLGTAMGRKVIYELARKYPDMLGTMFTPRDKRRTILPHAKCLTANNSC